VEKLGMGTGMPMLEEAEFYRARAIACRTLAARTANAAYRRELEGHARFYEKLAERATSIRPTALDVERDSALMRPPRAKPRKGRPATPGSADAGVKGHKI
jgi:hypothetical protein